MTIGNKLSGSLLAFLGVFEELLCDRCELLIDSLPLMINNAVEPVPLTAASGRDYLHSDLT